jgi:hypothetical protein
MRYVYFVAMNQKQRQFDYVVTLPTKSSLPSEMARQFSIAAIEMFPINRIVCMSKGDPFTNLIDPGCEDIVQQQ